MKKTKLSSTSPILYLLGLIPLVRAGPVEGVQQLLSGLGDVLVILIQFISDTILDINSFDEFLFAKILLFSIILIVTYTVIKQNTLFGGKKNKPIQWIISSAVSILAIRYLPDEFIQAILLQYSALAVGITVFLPLMIYFFFLHQAGFGPAGRKLGWMVFAASFLALWSFRYSELGDANWIYWIGIAFILLALLFDKSIHEYFGMSSIRKARSLNKLERKGKAQRDLYDLEENREHFSDSEYERLKEKYEDAIKNNL